MVNFLEQHQILFGNQHDIIRKRSCETQHLSPIQEIGSSTVRRKEEDVILTDRFFLDTGLDKQKFSA